MTADPATPAGPLRRLLGRRLVRAGIVTYVFSALTLVAYTVSGIVAARALGPSGRGITAALSMVSQLAAFIFAMGAARSLSYFISRRPDEGPRLLTTWVLMLVPLTAVAIAVTELLLPTIFATDGQQAIDTGRWFLFTIILAVGLELAYGLLLGIEDIVWYNALRFAQPTLIALALVVLWVTDTLTVNSSLLAAAAATAVTVVAAMGRSISRIGVGRPDFRLGLGSLWYGLRGQGAAVATTITARLDVAVLPAYVIPASVGLYSVATNVSLIVYHLSNIFAGVVIPAAARDPERGPAKVIGSLWASLAVAGLIAVILALLARPLLGLVYGDQFQEAADSLLILLPGSVLFAGASILAAGIYAAGRPFTATLAQLLGMVVTVVGLAAFLRRGGINAAAWVSTASYATVFLATLFVYKDVSGRPWRAFVPSPMRLKAILR